MAAVDPAVVAQLEAALTASSTEPNPALQRQGATLPRPQRG